MYTAGQVAQQTDINVETLRYYEREGLLPQPKRSEAGYRLYDPSDVTKVRFILKARLC